MWDTLVETKFPTGINFGQAAAHTNRDATGSPMALDSIMIALVKLEWLSHLGPLSHSLYFHCFTIARIVDDMGLLSKQNV